MLILLNPILSQHIIFLKLKGKENNDNFMRILNSKFKESQKIIYQDNNIENEASTKFNDDFIKFKCDHDIYKIKSQWEEKA